MGSHGQFGIDEKIGRAVMPKRKAHLDDGTFCPHSFPVLRGGDSKNQIFFTVSHLFLYDIVIKFSASVIVFSVFPTQSLLLKIVFCSPGLLLTLRCVRILCARTQTTCVRRLRTRAGGGGRDLRTRTHANSMRTTHTRA